MLDIYRTYNLTVSFLKGIFSSEEELIFIEKDNRGTKFIFNFLENINNQNVILKIKHYTGIVKEVTLTVHDNVAEFVFTNDILIAGNLKMSISLIGTENEILTSTAFLENIIVKESLGEGEAPSEDEISELEKAISALNKSRNIERHRISVISEIPELTEYELPCDYKVGNNSLSILYNNEVLICEKSEEDAANYREVGNAGETSNKVVFGWDIEIGSTLEVIVRGDIENAEN